LLQQRFIAALGSGVVVRRGQNPCDFAHKCYAVINGLAHSLLRAHAAHQLESIGIQHDLIDELTPPRGNIWRERTWSMVEVAALSLVERPS
jgi:hypothetical protein